MRNLIRREDLDALKAAEKLHKSDDKIIGFIYESYEYDKFKKLLGNRDIDEGNKNKLRESMRIKQLPIPGVVNEGLEVIDAQTRLSVCEEDKMPFIYICAPGMNIDDCILANTNSKNWSVKNRLKTYADRGNENYKRFIDMEELKPCPFCGGKAAVRISTTNYIPTHARANCYCKECLSTGKKFDDDDDDGTCVFKAVEAWNTRAE